jgi:hypothetical protein
MSSIPGPKEQRRAIWPTKPREHQQFNHITTGPKDL